MKNVTVSIDDDTYRRARIAAAERGTSVSAMVRDFLRSMSGRVDEPAHRAAALFVALDQAGPYRARDRLGREESHARKRVR